MTEFPLPPDTPFGFSKLIDGELWDRLVAEGKVFGLDDPRQSIQYLRLKPGACRVFLMGDPRESADTPPQGILLRIFDDRERASLAFEKEKTRRPLPSPDGFKPFLDEESGVVGLPFPNDPEIPELRRIYEPDRFRRLALELVQDRSSDQWRLQRSLTKFRLLAYKPGRRAVLRAKLKFRHLTEDQKIRIRLHLKVEKKATAQMSIKQAQQISSATTDCKNFQTPQFLGAASNGSLFAHEWCDGKSIFTSGENLTDVLRTLGTAVAEFHSLPLEINSHVPPQLMLDEVNILAADLTRLIPGCGSDIQSITDELLGQIPILSSLPSSLLHGDLHLDQFLINKGMPIIVDFDRAGRGYACLDIGSLLEDLRIRGVDEAASVSFVEGYQQQSDRQLLPQHIVIGRVLAILRRASEPLRNLEMDWQDQLQASLSECHRLLAGGEK
ncbi:MAG: aminoglycoside phosphotransferase family protein [Planctomycetota bacterium]|nr:aminoglycoside phosphotransferase family protein [Planctomycetota bacterium]